MNGADDTVFFVAVYTGGDALRLTTAEAPASMLEELGELAAMIGDAVRDRVPEARVIAIHRSPERVTQAALEQLAATIYEEHPAWARLPLAWVHPALEGKIDLGLVRLPTVPLALADYARDDECAADAIGRAVREGWALNLYADPEQDGAEGVDADDAIEAAGIDLSLVYLTRKGE